MTEEWPTGKIICPDCKFIYPSGPCITMEDKLRELIKLQHIAYLEAKENGKIARKPWHCV